MSKKFTKVESIAIRLCQIRNLNPFEVISHGADPDAYGIVYDVLLYSERYTRVVREVEQFLQVLTAIKEVEEVK